MKKILSLGLLTLFISYTASAEESLIRLQSPYTAQATADRFETIAKEKGLNVFARINHQQNAAGVDMELRPTEVIIFGNPKVGTPLMQCAQEVGIDLPQKVLIMEDENKQVWLSYNNPEYLKNRHNIEGCDAVLTKIAGVLNTLSAAAVAGQ
ncbi:DUF302 domain-containing protein [Oceanisphaera psychrotolerans]|uniref:DUF302 domain-containing protein n=1 Tax=Oceanisphaera psychrotolerans TaxID=1414654 RepID=A0A1J4QGE3_9GAMM|nr:DUF302 domain-containing protein [Oceanisphaera psychrotolerans]OIN12748.1 hypothetical protein BFR47_11290 [Oceanisphaera psychrotolerans]